MQKTCGKSSKWLVTYTGDGSGAELRSEFDSLKEAKREVKFSSGESKFRREGMGYSVGRFHIFNECKDPRFAEMLRKKQ